MTFLEIASEIHEGKNLDIHLKSEDKFVRKLLAIEGFKLDVLIKDPAEEVRAAVAARGYGLEQLLNDKSDHVRFAALDAVHKLRSRNAGYDIVHRIEVGGNHFVVGHNPKAPAAYVTWQFIEPKGYYYQGHYFSEEKDALIDLFRRAGEELDLGSSSLARELLTQEDHVVLREESARDAVCYLLEEYLSGDDSKYNYDALIADEAFMQKALNLYYGIDHSAENEAFTDNLEQLLEEFPQHKVQDQIKDDQIPEVKIPPELHQLANDLLTIPTEAAAQKYGPLGDNLEFTFKLAFGIKAVLEIVPQFDVADANKLSATEPHAIKVSVFGADGKPLDTDPKVTHFPDSDSLLTGSFEVTVNDTITLTLALHEDESLRRVGNTFMYKALGTEERYTKHDGEVCTIQRALTPNECDILQVGLMWVATFPNGDQGHVFDEELSQPAVEPRKPSLSEQLKSADARQTDSAKPSANLPEHRR